MSDAAVVRLQSAQAAACNSRHTVRQRLAYWLAIASVELRGDVVPLTHNELARLAGIRRPSVTQCLGALQTDGALKLRRGTIEIVDHAALDAACCHCLKVVKHEYERVLQGHRATAREEVYQARDGRAAAPDFASPYLHEIGEANGFITQPIAVEGLFRNGFRTSNALTNEAEDCDARR